MKVDDLHTCCSLAYEAVSEVTGAIGKFAVFRNAETRRVVIVGVSRQPSAIRRRTTVEPVLSRWIVIHARLRVLVQTNPTAFRIRIPVHRNDHMSSAVYNYYVSCFGLRVLNLQDTNPTL